MGGSSSNRVSYSVRVVGDRPPFEWCLVRNGPRGKKDTALMKDSTSGTGTTIQECYRDAMAAAKIEEGRIQFEQRKVTIPLFEEERPEPRNETVDLADVMAGGVPDAIPDWMAEAHS